MKLANLDLMSKNDLAAQYRQEGMAVLRSVTLPNVFEPPITDFVFLNDGQNCDVFIGSNVRYQGRTRPWRQVFQQEPGPGGTLQLLSTPGDFFTGFSKAKAMLEQAGGAYPEEVQQSEPAETAPAIVPNVPSPVQSQTEPAAIPRDIDRPLPEPGRETPERAQGGRYNGRHLRDLVEEWRRNPRDLAGRTDLVNILKTNLLRESKPGVVMVGKPGVGKTCIVELLACDIATNHDLPPALADTPIYDLPLGSLLENTRHVGDIERQAREILDSPGKPIFFADEIHQLARPELSALCDLLKPALATGRIRLIGATTPMEWRRLEDRAFKRRFLEMNIEEPSPAEAYVMAKARVNALERHHQMEINDELVREAVMLAARYLPMQQFPDKAVDVLDLAAALQAAQGAFHQHSSGEMPPLCINNEREGSAAPGASGPAAPEIKVEST